MATNYVATELDIQSIPLGGTVFRFPSEFELPGFYCSLTETCSFIAYFIDIGHPYYGQLAPAKTSYPLTTIK